MQKLSILYDIIEREKMHLRYCDLPGGFFGTCIITLNLNPIILLDNSLRNNMRKEKCVLAEEVGHARTAPRTTPKVYLSFKNIPANETVKMAQDERSALLWATSFCLPTDDVCRALRDGCQTVAELADYFEVTEWFVYRKLGFLKAELKQEGLRPCANELLRLEIVPELLSLAGTY